MGKRKVVSISVIGIILLLALCFGVAAFINNAQSKGNRTVELFSCLPSEIVGYTVKNNEESYTLLKEDGSWTVEGNHVAVLDQKLVQDVINGASRINSQGVLRRRDLKEYEETEKQVLEIALSSGETVVFDFVGTKGEMCAVRINDEDEIYSVHKSTRSILMASLDKLRVSLLFEELLRTDKILTYYSFTDYDKSKTVVRMKNAMEISNTKANRYVMDEPYRKDVDDEKFEQQILLKIPLIATAKYVDDFPEDLAYYGLDSGSRAVLKFIWGDMEETLYLGKDEGGFVYARKEGEKGVFVINSSQLEFLKTEPFFILESGILKSDIENIYRMSVRVGNENFEITSSDRNNSKKRFYVNGNAASEIAFNEAVEALGEIEILSEIAQVPKKDGDIGITVYYDNGMAAQSIRLVPSGEKEYAAFINGKAEFAVSRNTVDSLIKILKEISNNPMKTEEKG